MPEEFKNQEQSEDKNPPERESGVSGFVGFDPEREKSVRNFFKEKFLSGGDREIIGKYEREKTEEEKELIRDISSRMPEFIKRWGGNPLNISEANIHFLDKDKINENNEEKLKGGGYTLGRELIYITDSGKKLKNAINITHELIHFNSFQSVQSKDSKNQVFIPRRIGFEIHNRKGERLFEDINEAITVELEKRFEAEYFESILAISDEVKKRNRIREIRQGEWGDVAIILGEEKAGDQFKWTFEHYTYEEEREKLSQLMEEIYEKNKEKFNSKEDVFAVFAKASLSGKLLQIARLIEKTFGKESFRKLGKESKNK